MNSHFSVRLLFEKVCGPEERELCPLLLTTCGCQAGCPSTWLLRKGEPEPEQSCDGFTFAEQGNSVRVPTA